MKKLFLIFVLFLLPAIANPLSLVRPATLKFQLIAVVVDWCPYCNKWAEEVVPLYDDIIPLVIVNITSEQGMPEWYKKAYYTGRIEQLYSIPAFIIWDTEAKTELVRWTGYGGVDHFYQMLDKAINKAIEKQVLCSDTSALERHRVCKAEKIG
jgi:hypothetical protein